MEDEFFTWYSVTVMKAHVAFPNKAAQNAFYYVLIPSTQNILTCRRLTVGLHKHGGLAVCVVFVKQDFTFFSDFKKFKR